MKLIHGTNPAIFSILMASCSVHQESSGRLLGTNIDRPESEFMRFSDRIEAVSAELCLSEIVRELSKSGQEACDQVLGFRDQPAAEIPGQMRHLVGARDPLSAPLPLLRVEVGRLSAVDPVIRAKLQAALSTAFMAGKRYLAIAANPGSKLYVGTGRSNISVIADVTERARKECQSSIVYFLPEDLPTNFNCRYAEVSGTTECRIGVSCSVPNPVP